MKISVQNGSNLTDDDFIALLKTYDEVLILDDMPFNALTESYLVGFPFTYPLEVV